MTYLIIGATGDIGSKVVRELIALGHRPRVYVRDAAKANALFGDQVEIFTGDLADLPALTTALHGVNSLFLVNSGPRIPQLDTLAANAARATKVRHIVKLSSLDVEQHLAIGAWHEKGEAAIRASGIPYTFIRPTGFMSNLLAWSHSIKTEGVVRSSTGNGRRPFIHSADIAAVAVKALTAQDYIGQSLPITGPEALNFAEVTERIGHAIGRTLRYETISDEEARRRYSAVSGSEEETEAHVALWQAIREGRLTTVTNTVEQVLGHKPLTLDDWLAENSAEFYG